MSASALTINRVLSVIFAVILIPFSALTHGIDLLSAGERTDSAKTNVVGIGAYFRSQGITTDGETLYFSSKSGGAVFMEGKDTLKKFSDGEIKEFFKFKKTELVSNTKDRIFWFLTSPAVILATVASLLIATFLR